MIRLRVAPLVGAWIEIFGETQTAIELAPSLLSWERGLKYSEMEHGDEDWLVAPLVGAWIEIRTKPSPRKNFTVAPLVGAWIEIQTGRSNARLSESLLSWERGLKFVSHVRIKKR